MGVSKTHITNLLEMRFDFLSARNVLNNWRKLAGIKEDIEDFDDNSLKSLLAYLKDDAPDAKRVHDAIERLIINKDAQEEVKAAEVHHEEAPVEEHHEEAPVEYHEEAPAEEHHEDAPAEEAPAEDAAAEEAPAENAEEAPAENNNGGKKKKKKH